MKNQLIENKIDEKTQDDQTMNNFMKCIFEVEVQNKQYRAHYLAYIEQALKKEDSDK